MSRILLLEAIEAAQRESDRAARSLALLKNIVHSVLQISGENVRTYGADLEPELQELIRAPKPLLRQWAAICSRDPLLASLIRARKNYAQTDARRGKGARGLEVVVLVSYQEAIPHGFKGSRNQWEELLRMR